MLRKNSNKLELIIVIPVYNEEQVINRVIEDWLKTIKDLNAKILIINDGSTDRTLNYLRRVKSKKIMVKSQINAGHGRALMNGYKTAIKLKPDYIFQVDSDNQFSTKNFISFWSKRKVYDLQIGYRKNRFDSLERLIITRILRLALFIMFGVFILDSNIPYRLMNTKKFRLAFSKVDKNFNAPNILIAIIFFKNFKCKTNLVIHKERKTGQVFAVNYKLFKFCFNSFLQLIKFRFKNLSI